MTDWLTLKEASAIIGIKPRAMLKRIQDGLIPIEHHKQEELPFVGKVWFVTREYAESTPRIHQKDRSKNKEK